VMRARSEESWALILEAPGGAVVDGAGARDGQPAHRSSATGREVDGHDCQSLRCRGGPTGADVRLGIGDDDTAVQLAVDVRLRCCRQHRPRGVRGYKGHDEDWASAVGTSFGQGVCQQRERRKGEDGFTMPAAAVRAQESSLFGLRQ
jgi:hypothetical protein